MYFSYSCGVSQGKISVSPSSWERKIVQFPYWCNIASEGWGLKQNASIWSLVPSQRTSSLTSSPVLARDIDSGQLGTVVPVTSLFSVSAFSILLTSSRIREVESKFWLAFFTLTVKITSGWKSWDEKAKKSYKQVKFYGFFQCGVLIFWSRNLASVQPFIRLIAVTELLIDLKTCTLVLFTFCK